MSLGPGAPPPYLLAEDLLLLTLDPVTGKERRPVRSQVFGGALLVDLGLLGLVRVEPGGFLRKQRITVVGAPPPDQVLGHALARVHTRNGSPLEVGRSLADGARDAVLHRLAGRGVLRYEEGRTLGIRRARWPASDTSRRDLVSHELVGVLLHGAPAHPRTAALASILVRTGLARGVLPLPRRTRFLHDALLQRTDLDPGFLFTVDACVDACGDNGSSVDGGGGGDGGGDGGGGGGGGD